MMRTLKNVKSVKDNPNGVLESNVDPNKDENIPQENTSEEIRSKHKSKGPKNHPISNFIGNMNECVVARRQSRLNEMDLACYTFQL